MTFLSAPEGVSTSTGVTKAPRESGLLESHNGADACVRAMSVPLGELDEESLAVGRAVAVVGLATLSISGVGARDEEQGRDFGSV